METGSWTSSLFYRLRGFVVVSPPISNGLLLLLLGYGEATNEKKNKISLEYSRLDPWCSIVVHRLHTVGGSRDSSLFFFSYFSAIFFVI